MNMCVLKLTQSVYKLTMLVIFLRISLFIIFFLFSSVTLSIADFVDEIQIKGNSRISSETILLFSKIDKNDLVDENYINNILKELYQTNFFKNISVKLDNKILIITVDENPIIENISYEGVKAQKIRDEILKNLKLKPRSSFNNIILKEDNRLILDSLKNLGYYFAKVDTYIEELDENKINLTYEIDIGNKSKIKKISFIGNKVFKNNKLRNIIVSEEHKFWKFLSGKKYLNENLTRLDTRLLKNFYLNEGYFNVEINKSYAKLLSDDEFELIFNIDAKSKFFFNEIKLDMPNDFDENNFSDISKLFKKIKGKPYSINLVEKILNEIEIITTNEQNLSVSADVNEEIIDDKINLTFKINEDEKYLVKKINIFGNNITRENVIRNQLELDEGDIFNEILNKKSLNNIKNLNFFKNVKADVVDDVLNKSKIINISVEEKATGEISAGAGLGTSGGTVTFGIKENNYLGKGLGIISNITIDPESLKGLLTISDPNFKNSNKSVYGSIQATEDDRLKDFGYKSSKTGFSIGTNFEYLDDLFLGLSTSSFYESVLTDSTASARQKKQAGDYWDTFLKLDFDYDKRNQKFKTSDGFRSIYQLTLPVISETNTLTNSYEYKYYNEIIENSITRFSFYLKSSQSLTGDDIKLSERLFIPSKKLRGFERGKVGPKDGNDYVGGNFITSLNLSSDLPIILQDNEDMDLSIFFDAANIWGVDYDSSINDHSGIRSSVGISVDWWTPIGPLNFSVAQPITDKPTDITETFRFNIGTTF